MLARKQIHLEFQKGSGGGGGGVGGFPHKLKIFVEKKIKQMKAFPFKARFFLYFLAGLPESPKL